MYAQAWSKLPEEILVEVMARLDNASVQSCRCVCREWSTQAAFRLSAGVTTGWLPDDSARRAPFTMVPHLTLSHPHKFQKRPDGGVDGLEQPTHLFAQSWPILARLTHLTHLRLTGIYGLAISGTSDKASPQSKSGWSPGMWPLRVACAYVDRAALYGTLQSLHLLQGLTLENASLAQDLVSCVCSLGSLMALELPVPMLESIERTPVNACSTVGDRRAGRVFAMDTEIAPREAMPRFSFSSLLNLHVLSLRGQAWVTVESLAGIEDLKALTRLDIGNCPCVQYSIFDEYKGLVDRLGHLDLGISIDVLMRWPEWSSRPFRDVVPEVESAAAGCKLTALVLEGRRMTDNLAHRIARFRCLRLLDLHHTTAVDVQAATLESWTCLTRLSRLRAGYLFVQGNPNYAGLDGVLRRLPLLQSLNVAHLDRWAVMGAGDDAGNGEAAALAPALSRTPFPKLADLSLEDCSGFRGWRESDAVSTVSQLHALNLSDCGSTSSQLCPILRHAGSLRALDLAANPLLNNSVWAVVNGSTMPHLSRLSLQLCRNVSALAWVPSAASPSNELGLSSLTRLADLDLSGTSITPRTTPLVGKLIALTALRLLDCTRLDAPSMASLQPLQAVRELYLSLVDLHGALAPLLRGWHHLGVLVAVSCGLDSSDIVGLAVLRDSLRMLCIDNTDPDRVLGVERVRSCCLRNSFDATVWQHLTPCSYLTRVTVAVVDDFDPFEVAAEIFAFPALLDLTMRIMVRAASSPPNVCLRIVAEYRKLQAELAPCAVASAAIRVCWELWE